MKISYVVVVLSVMSIFLINSVNAFGAMDSGVDTTPKNTSKPDNTSKPGNTQSPKAGPGGLAGGDTSGTQADPYAGNRPSVSYGDGKGNIPGATSSGLSENGTIRDKNVTTNTNKNTQNKPHYDEKAPSESIDKSSTINDWFRDARDFIEEGEKKATVDQNELHKTSNTLYNILLAAGIASSVVVGMILGIKYMMGSVEEKADLKQLLVAYAVGCIVIFGAFGIWKLVVQILSDI